MEPPFQTPDLYNLLCIWRKQAENVSISFHPKNKIGNFLGLKTDAHWQSKWNYWKTLSLIIKRGTLKMCVSFSRSVIWADALLFYCRLIVSNQKYSIVLNTLAIYKVTQSSLNCWHKEPAKIIPCRVAVKGIKQQFIPILFHIYTYFLIHFWGNHKIGKDLKVWEMITACACSFIQHAIFYCWIFATLSASFLMKFQVQLDHFFEIK